MRLSWAAVADLVGDASKLQNATNWRPKHSLNNMMKALLDERRTAEKAIMKTNGEHFRENTRGVGHVGVGSLATNKREWSVKLVRSLFHFLFDRWSARAVGHVDKFEQCVVYGWACFPNDSRRRCLVDVFLNGSFVGQALANLHRADLLSAGVGDGAHGFELDLRHTNLGSSLKSGIPLKLEAFALDASRTRLISHLDPVPTGTRAQPPANAECYIRETFKNPSRPEVLTRFHQARASAQVLFCERLLAATPIGGPPGCLGRPIGAYQDFVRLQGKREGLFEPSLTLSESAEFLKWYLSTYGRTRGVLRAPLSASDISFLNDGPKIGHSRAQEMFAGLFAKPEENADPVQSVFLWGAFNAAVLAVEDCLISNADLSLAATSERPKQEPYPLSPFMRLFIKGNPFLASLRTSTIEERAFVYFVVMLFATAAPHLLKFIPPAWRDALVAKNDEGRTLFDKLSDATFAPQPAPINAETWKALITSRDFNLRINDFATRSTTGARIYAAARELAPVGLADVQVIGPVTRALGVGASCRRLVRALELTGYAIRCCDFSLDHPNKTVESPDLPLSPLGPARVNILHLNLEELPKAVAYCADVFSGAYNIAFPYLELAPPSPIQILGLSLVDEVWAASHFIADTLASYAKTFVAGSCCDDAVPIGRVMARKRAYGGFISIDDFVFLTAGDALSSAHRKNPLGAARAFLHAFPDNPRVRLVIKTHSTEKAHGPYEQAVWRALRSLAEADSRISLMDEYIDEASHYALIEGCDAFLSLHRAEGLGYHILEAMRLGTPVITTAYSGNTDFCTDMTAFLVPYRLIPVVPAYPNATPDQRWADPDHSVAVKQLRRLYEDREAAREKADAARNFVATRFSARALAQNVSIRLKDLVGEKLGAICRD